MKNIEEIRKRIGTIKQEIANLGDMRLGSLTVQPRSWGKNYWQLSYTYLGRGYTKYISNENYQTVKEQTDNYKKFKALCAELVDLSLSLAKITDKETSQKK